MQPADGIYFDNNATTPVDARVIEAMSASLELDFGNPESPHRFGERAAAALAAARSSVARLLGARSPREIVFTSGGTEANNCAIHAALARAAQERRLVLTSALEHASVRMPLAGAVETGFEVEAVGPGPDGGIDARALLARLEEEGERCALLSVMWANNETGVVLQPDELGALAAACRRHAIPFHVDGVQAPGKVPMQVAELGMDLLSISAHKFHGPKGIGALYVRSGFEEDGFEALLRGGPQERGRRAGTPNVAGIVGLGRAAELAIEQVAGEPGSRPVDRVRRLRESFERGLCEAIPGCRIHAEGAARLPNTTCIGFPGVDGEILLSVLAEEGLAASSGAACSTDLKSPSHVLLAMGLSRGEASASLRFSLSGRNTESEVESARERVIRAVSELQGLLSGS